MSTYPAMSVCIAQCAKGGGRRFQKSLTSISLYLPFGASRAAYGPGYPIYGIFGSFWTILEPPYGTTGTV